MKTKNRKTVGLVLSVLLVINIFCILPLYSQTLPWDYTITTNNHTLLIQPGVVTINGNPIQNGDVIGVFYQNGTNLECGGYGTWSGSLIAITAWGDDSGTSLKEGFSTGEVFQWKVWQASSGYEGYFSAQYLSSFPNSNAYIVNGTSGLTGLSGIITAPLTPTPPPLLFDSIIANNSCYGSCMGSIDLEIDSGVPPYYYYWSNGETLQDLDSLCSGIYTVTVYDSTSNPPPILPWSYSVTGGNHTILIQPNVLQINGGPLNPGDYIGVFFDSLGTLACGGYSEWTNSTIAVAAWGKDVGNDGFDIGEAFTWKAWKAIDGQEISLSPTYNQIGFPNQGNYELNGVSGLSSLTGTYSANPYFNFLLLDFEVTSPPQIVISDSLSNYSGFNVSAIGASDGFIDITISGGTSPYTLMWSNGATTEDLMNIPAGNYSLTVLDADSCSQVESFFLTQPFYISSTVFDSQCGNFCGGEIFVSVQGGMSPYSFAWSNGASSDSISGLCQGNYELTLSDNSTPPNDTVFAFAVDGPPALVLTAQQSDYGGSGVSAIGASDGWIDITVSGGNSPYTFSWSNGETSEDLINIPAGNYAVTVLDADSCTIAESFLLEELMGFAGTVSDATCFGICDGEISLSIFGGILPIDFSWSNGETTQNVSGLCAGTYMVTLTDSIGSTSTDTFVVSSWPEIVASAQLSDYGGYGVSASGVSDGWIDISVSGGLSPFSYSWQTGASSEDIQNLMTGNYQLTVSDANACSQTFSFYLSTPAYDPSLVVNSTITEISCIGACDGAIELSATGGTPWYNFFWNDGTYSPTRYNLCPGNYSVTVTDSPVTTGNPSSWAYVYSSSNHSIFIPSISVNGVAPNVGDMIGAFFMDNTATLKCAGYTVFSGGPLVVSAWEDDGNDTGFSNGEFIHWRLLRASDSVVVDMEATYSTSQPNQGYFQGNGISHITSIVGIYNPQNVMQDTVLTFTISQPDSIALNPVVINVDTSINLLGSIHLNPIGGVSPYSFQWSNGDTLEDISLLDTGWYSITLTDANLCEKVGEFNITYETYLPLSASLTNLAHPTCYGSCDGSVGLLVDNGIFPYSYHWSNGESSVDANSLCAGMHTVTIYDYSDSLILPFEMINPDSIFSTAQITHVDPLDPFSGSISVIPSGGTSPYTFEWENSFGFNSNLDSISIGSYSLIISDSLNCQSTETFNLGYTYYPDSINIQGVVQDASCPNACNGEIDLTVSGGISPYSYQWSSGNTTQNVTGLCAGNHEVTVTDALNGYQLMDWDYVNTGSFMECYVLFESTFTQWDTCDIIGVFYNDNGVLKCGGYGQYDENAACYGMDFDFKILAYADDPATPDKDGFVTGESVVFRIWRLVDGTTENLDINSWVLLSVPLMYLQDYYLGFILESYNSPLINHSSASFTITEPDPISVSAVLSDYGGYNVSTWGASDGSIDITVLGGTSPYSYLWNGGQTYEDLSNIPAGTYEILVTDANQCDTLGLFELFNPPPDPIFATATTTDNLCWGSCDGAIEVVATGGMAPLNFSWSNGETSSTVTNLCAGSYGLTISDADSSLVLNYEILQPDSIFATIVITSVDPSTGIGGSIDVTVTGGTQSYSFAWSNGATTEDLIPADYGPYQLTVTDANLCQTDFQTFVDFTSTPAWPVIQTANTHTIDIPASANLLLYGNPLSANDFLGVFYDSLGVEYCGGYVVWQNQAASLVAYGDDPTSSDKDGFETGEAFSWKIWDASEDLTHDAVAVYQTGYPNQGLFISSGYSGIDSVYTNSLSGTVSTTTKSPLTLGMVVVYEQTTLGYRALTKGLVENGTYQIDGLPTGNYICYAIPQPGNDWGIPGYYTARDDWQGANWVHVQANTTGINIVLDPVLPYNTGTASISGNITVGSDQSYNPEVFDNEWFPPSTKTTGVPARNIPVLLYDSLQNAIDFRLTDEQGVFGYHNLEYGTYFVKVEKAGLEAEHVEIVLDASNPTSSGIGFELNQGHVISIDQVDAQKEELLVYPNPANIYLMVEMPKGYEDLQSIQVFSQLGQEQRFEYSWVNQQEGRLILNISVFKSGIYFLRLISENKTGIVKFVRQ